MPAAVAAFGKVWEDGSYSVLARVAALEGTGLEYVAGEGNVLKQVDITSVTGKVFNLGTDKNNLAGTEVTPAPTLTVSGNFYDVLRTVGWPTPGDPHGYNFRMDLGVIYTADPDTWYLFEARITLTGGGVIWVVTKVKTVPVQT